jgi:hypothetical protein
MYVVVVVVVVVVCGDAQELFTDYRLEIVV